VKLCSSWKQFSRNLNLVWILDVTHGIWGYLGSLFLHLASQRRPGHSPDAEQDCAISSMDCLDISHLALVLSCKHLALQVPA
jgi:hypothetical protein